MTWRTVRELKVLDFDLENRPLTYLGSDFTTAEVTAIAAGWTDQKRVYCWALGECSTEEMLTGFREMFDKADVVTGHYIRKHDLPILNGALLEAGLPTLGAKLTSDTKLDLVKRKDISAGQEALAGMYGLWAHKHHMSQPQWREANRLTPAGIKQTRKRVIDDVRQHKQLRARLIEAGALKPPRRWVP